GEIEPVQLPVAPPVESAAERSNPDVASAIFTNAGYSERCQSFRGTDDLEPFLPQTHQAAALHSDPQVPFTILKPAAGQVPGQAVVRGIVFRFAVGLDVKQT